MSDAPNSLHEAAFAHAPVALLVADGETGHIVLANDLAARMLGYTRAELLELVAEDLIPAASRYRHIAHRKAFDEAPSHRSMGAGANLEVRRAGGSPLAVDIAVSPVGNGLVCVAMSDATENRREGDRLYRLANEDPLTGLDNRRGLETKLAARMSDARRDTDRIAIVMADVDRFKEINDRAGHLVGDEMLVAVANTMRARVRDEDLVARVGGDEFMLCLTGADRDQAAQVAEDVRARIEQLNFATPGGTPISTSLSLGVALRPEDGDDVFGVIAVADTRLYAAKAAGRNTVQAVS
ncbi:MAG: GGDEF domain-containing protein [Solirubrobacteraceae bacterium]|nr:GGDEF domain-containing protein [Solirubrobacteraceae bacterium]